MHVCAYMHICMGLAVRSAARVEGMRAEVARCDEGTVYACCMCLNCIHPPYAGKRHQPARRRSAFTSSLHAGIDHLMMSQHPRSLRLTLLYFSATAAHSHHRSRYRHSRCSRKTPQTSRSRTARGSCAAERRSCVHYYYCCGIRSALLGSRRGIARETPPNASLRSRCCCIPG